VKVLSVLCCVVLLALGAATAASGDNGGQWTPWQPATQGPLHYEAGSVCPFAVSATFPTQDLRFRYLLDSSGNVTEVEFIGPLIAEVTNDETGKTVQRNISGRALLIFNPDGSATYLNEGHLGIAFHAGDTPSKELDVISGHFVMNVTPEGHYQLVELNGTSENVCETLA
jgi:hypothetical protein